MEITCINCPIGCRLDVTLESDKVTKVAGGLCKRGETYAQMECTNPTRVLTTTLPIQGSDLKRVSVKTAKPIPKHKMFECLAAIKRLTLTAPVKVGDVVMKDICQTGVALLVTRSANKC